MARLVAIVALLFLPGMLQPNTEMAAECMKMLHFHGMVVQGQTRRIVSADRWVTSSLRVEGSPSVLRVSWYTQTAVAHCSLRRVFAFEQRQIHSGAVFEIRRGAYQNVQGLVNR